MDKLADSIPNHTFIKVLEEIEYEVQLVYEKQESEK